MQNWGGGGGGLDLFALTEKLLWMERLCQLLLTWLLLAEGGGGGGGGPWPHLWKEPSENDDI